MPPGGAAAAAPRRATSQCTHHLGEATESPKPRLEPSSNAVGRHAVEVVPVVVVMGGGEEGDRGGGGWGRPWRAGAGDDGRRNGE
jgi:hypothetical protein